MIRLSALVLICLIIGCNSHPTKGDYYEHRGTRERVKVEDVGEATKIVQAWREAEKEIVLAKLSLISIRFQDTNLLKRGRAVVFTTARNSLLLTYYIVPLDKFVEDYALVP